MVEPIDGISGVLPATLPVAMTLSAFAAISWYNTVELNVMIWTTFKTHKGLYFWSLLISSWGTAIFSLAFMLKFFLMWRNAYVSIFFITVGWWAMVTGQSLVLYSRLHIVVHNQRAIKWVLFMIIADFFLFQVTTTVLTFGANSSLNTIFEHPYKIMEKIEVTTFFVQEFLISSLYIFETWRMLKPMEEFQKKRTRQTLLHLIYINALFILMDLAIVVTEFNNLYAIQVILKGAIYSIKLKLEFAILTRLKSIATAHSITGRNPANFNHSWIDLEHETSHENTKWPRGQVLVRGNDTVCSEVTAPITAIAQF